MTIRRTLALLAVTGTFAAITHAQQPEPTPQPKSNPIKAAAPEPNPGPMVTVEFAGGTVKQFVEAVRLAAAPGKVNVIMPMEAEKMTLPAVSLREVTTYVALQALEYAAWPEGGNQLAITRLGNPGDPSATFAIRVASRQMGLYQNQPPAMPVRQETRVFSIRELVEPPAGMESNPSAATTTETLLTALEAASKMDADAKVPPPELMLHKDSLLLLVRGTMEQHRTVESVLQQLTQASISKRSRAAEVAQREKAAKLEQVELQAQLDMNQAQLKATELEVAHATANAERVKKMVEQGQATQFEMQNAEGSLVQARAIFDQARAQARSLQERAAIIKARTDAGGTSFGPSETPVLVVYDFRDLEPFAGDIIVIFRAVAAQGRTPGEMQVDMGPNISQGTAAVRATPGQHRIIVSALNAIRRAKSNEPKLPGLEAEDLIRKSQPK